MTTQATVTDKFVKINGLRIHYLDWGNPTAHPMIMLHGLRSYAHVWDDVAKEFCDKYHILSLDQRGRGDSDWAVDGKYDTDDYVSDFEQFVDQLGLNRFILIGHSMGGTNSIVYASRHPEKVTALIIVDNGPRPSTPRAADGRIRQELETTPRFFASLDEAAAMWRAQRPTLTEEAAKMRAQNTVKELPDGKWTWKWDFEGISKASLNADPSKRIDLWPYVRNIKCPTLVVRGEKSDAFSIETAEEMKRANGNIRWVEIPNATHTVYEDNLDDFNSEVGVFLREVDTML